MPDISQVSIINLGLTKIGAKRISALDEDSAEARAANAIYDFCLDSVLEEHPWTFAQKRAALAQLDTTLAMTEDNLDYVYAKPTDYIKLNFVSSSTATVKVEDAGIISNVSGLKIIYTYRNTDPTKYSAKFIEALACKLASELCFPLGESVSKSEALIKKYEDIDLPKAISSDSQQGTPQPPIQDEWFEAREAGGGFLTTGETWHPA